VTVGILALQGDVREHAAAFDDLGVPTRPVRRPGDLDGLDGIVLPGGESTTLSLLLGSTGLFEPLHEALDRGLPVFGTCAGLVLLAREVLDGRPDQRTFGVLDCSVRRNGYGRQRFSFETTLDPGMLPGGAGATAGPLPAVFIRAPRVIAVGPTVEVLAELPDPDGGSADPVVFRQGTVLGCAFHPELTGDRRLHRLFCQMTGVESGSR
jgi:5'-phosphate synthase pdxT subunit